MPNYSNAAPNYAISEFENPSSNPYYATIKAIATANAETYNLYSPNIGLYIRVEHKITEGETLKTIISRTLSPPDSTSEGQPELTAESQLEYIAIANRNRLGLLKVGHVLTHGEMSYTIAAGDTFASLASTFNLSELAIIRLVQARDILAAESSLRLLVRYVTIDPNVDVHVDYTVKADETLDMILSSVVYSPELTRDRQLEYVAIAQIVAKLTCSKLVKP